MASNKKKYNRKKRTREGNVKASARKKHATYRDDGKGKFPIFDKKSAKSAIRLRGHASPQQRQSILRRAAKYAPEAAKKARERDRKSK